MDCRWCLNMTAPNEPEIPPVREPDPNPPPSPQPPVQEPPDTPSTPPVVDPPAPDTVPSTAEAGRQFALFICRHSVVLPTFGLKPASFERMYSPRPFTQ